MPRKKEPGMPQENGNVASDGGGKYGRIPGRRVARTVSFAYAGAEDLQQAIVAITTRGDAVMFSRTADGGALSIQVFSGPDKYKFWASSPEELAETLADLSFAAEGRG